MSLILLHFNLLCVLFAHLDTQFVVFLISIIIDVHIEPLVLVVLQIILPWTLFIAMAFWLQQV